MRKVNLLISAIMILIVPYMLFTFYENDDNPQRIELIDPSDEHRNRYIICVKDGSSIRELELDEYITGVVLAEMPASFEMEALKAQAVATRTYTLRCAMRSNKHMDADVCTKAACCQAYISPEAYTGGDKNLLKVRQSVDSTSGQVVTYQGNLIEATYFSCSGGQTEDAVAVWGNDVPYLQSVSSPGEETAEQFSSEYTFTIPEFRSRLGLLESTPVSGESISLTYTDAKSVDSMMVGNELFSGTQVRALLSLSSASFTVDVTEQSVVIRTNGNGHRVGMSQYGADAMAMEGKQYDEILTHYYTGTKVVTLTDEQLYTIFDKEENL